MIPLENAPVWEGERTPLEITVTLASPPVFYDPPTLDTLLAYAVIQNATQGRGLRQSAEPYEIPLPLKKLWECTETGLPLWDATQFFPIEPNTQQSGYWHKRGYSPQFLKRGKKGKPHNANFSNGIYKEYRMPMPMQTALKWRAYARGDVDGISHLLSKISTMSKKRSQGYGTVAKWEIEQIEDFPYWRGNKLIKTFPVAAAPELPINIIYDVRPAAWTPPYWLETIFTKCIL